jgi:putative ATP-dependent endonuclease of the OLD family
MYLRTIAIKNFRCFGEDGTFFNFQKGVNVIIGENNAGKTALIDALRIVFGFGGRRELYLTYSDFHLQQDGILANVISIDVEFDDLTDDEQAGFYEMLVFGPIITAQIHVRFIREEIKGIEKIRSQVWGGEKQGQSISIDTFDLINFYYLGALRDAESDLGPGKGSKLGQLLRKMVVDDNVRQKVLSYIRMANLKILGEPQISKAGDVINSQLEEIGGKRIAQKVQLGIIPPDFNRIVDSLRALLPANDINPKSCIVKEKWEKILLQYPTNKDLLNSKSKIIGEKVFIDVYNFSQEERNQLPELLYLELIEHVVIFELGQNGMGYNNLIYMGTVLGDLKEKKLIDICSYNALLIEEPEAHLHPQLQDLIFDFFNKVCNGHAPVSFPIQVFITSHSPILTSRADLDSVTVVYRSSVEGIKCISLNQCPLTDPYKKDLRRYLDVTKSRLFFSKGVILVEGISEQLLLPVFAKRIGRRLDQNAVEIVNINGVAFEPFALLFNSMEEKNRIGIPSAIITDDDRCTNQKDPFRIEEDLDLPELVNRLRNGEISHRAVLAKKFEAGNLIVRTAFKTLEFELALIPENVEIMVDVLDGLHSNVAKDIRKNLGTINEPVERAALIWRAVKKDKAIFSQNLAEKLSQYDSNDEPIYAFTIPKYIQEAIEYVTLHQLGRDV